MKKITLCLILAALSATGASADRLLFLGTGVGIGVEDREILPGWSNTSIDVQMSYFLGSTFGLNTWVSVGYILGARSAGTPIDLGLYSLRMSTDAIMGIGYRLPVSGMLDATIGAGVYLGFASMFPDDYMNDFYGGSLVVGPGVQGMLTFPLTPNLLAAVNLAVGYGLFELVPIESDSYKGGIHAFLAVGVRLPF